MSKRPELVILSGELKGRRFAVGEGVLRLGRSSSNDIPIPDEELSRNHCLFEQVGETGIRVTDLASANGTVVNGTVIGNDPVDLKEGDVIEVGSTVLSVGDPKPDPTPIVSAGTVDLGLGAPTTDPSAAPSAATPGVKTRPPILRLLWIVAVLVPIAAIVAILLAPVEEPATQVPVAAETPVVREVVYEKVHADANGIFRYALTAAADGQLTVKIDDTSNNRHMAPKMKTLTPEGQSELNQILAYKTVTDLDDFYSGIEPDASGVDSLTLKVVYSTRVKTVKVINAQEPDEFAALREKLETFSKSELGVWAIAYSREKLIALAEQAVRLGQAKWEDRDVNHGNLAAAIASFEEARFYLETVDPKPTCMAEASDGLAKAKAELDKRYTDQRFLADRALNLSQWETARDELKILLEMVPDRKDDRNRDVRQKLISAENNLKKKGGK